MATATLLTTEHADGFIYGVTIKSDKGQTYTYPEIADRRSDAERLLRRLEQGDISPVHYDDVVYDFILELAYERLERNGLS